MTLVLITMKFECSYRYK